RGMSLYHGVPSVGLPLPAVNVETTLHIPYNRWLLFTRGPSWGPAVLFLGDLLVGRFAALCRRGFSRAPPGVGERAALRPGPARRGPMAALRPGPHSGVGPGRARRGRPAAGALLALAKRAGIGPGPRRLAGDARRLDAVGVLRALRRRPDRTPAEARHAGLRR